VAKEKLKSGDHLILIVGGFGLAAWVRSAPIYHGAKFGGRGRVLAEPEVGKSADHGDEVLELEWFDQEGVGAEFVGFIDVTDFPGRGQDDDAEGGECFIGTYLSCKCSYWEQA
jgi:hypothetical protein